MLKIAADMIRIYYEIVQEKKEEERNKKWKEVDLRTK